MITLRKEHEKPWYFAFIDFSPILIDTREQSLNSFLQNFTNINGVVKPGEKLCQLQPSNGELIRIQSTSACKQQEIQHR